MKLSAIAVCSLTIFQLLSHQLIAQNQPGSLVPRSSPVPTQNGITWNQAANSWRSHPVDLKTQVDPVASVLRKKRDSYWGRILAERVEMERRGLHLATPEGSPLRRDLAPDPQALWVVAVFESYTVHPVAEDASVMYTEMHFRVSRTLRAPVTASIPPGSVIDVDVIGGSVKKPSGDIKSFDIVPRVQSVRPGAEYLLSLRPFSETASYTMGPYWAIKDGVLAKGYDAHSPYIGQTIDEFSAHLSAINAER